jgi:hypothetical protein
MGPGSGETGWCGTSTESEPGESTMSWAFSCATTHRSVSGDLGHTTISELTLNSSTKEPVRGAPPRRVIGNDGEQAVARSILRPCVICSGEGDDAWYIFSFL